MHNVATAYAVYEAIVLQKPLVERAVTVGGECVGQSQNVWIPLGTSFEESFKFCRGFLREPRRVIMGGPMRGKSQATLAVMVTANTQAILALPKEIVVTEEVQPCIRCHRCVEVCPVGISPVMITLAAEKELFDIARAWGVEACIECGCCSYICPAKRPMVELIRYADTHAWADASDKSFGESWREAPARPEALPKETLIGTH